ncbi:hypothetical protein [Chromatium okenii]|uniref:hypothetical protein n=1 Tax=Chromatium okenii TaxID=61644 RepID=UPI0026F2CAE9|nr:hypothetical protein [Chromatium okenii]MBV5309820.1 hypothetical protein [Chromatium okenii]
MLFSTVDDKQVLIRFFIAGLVAGIFLASNTVLGAERVPVMIGGDTDVDACGAVGEVRGLDDFRGDGFLSVRKGPGSQYLEIDRLHNGDQVYLCNDRGNWAGIIYSTGGNLSASCNVSSSIANKQSYRGPCKSGWAYMKWLKLIAE